MDAVDTVAEAGVPAAGVFGRLEGAERLRAHAAIHQATASTDATPEQDARLLEWVRRDPSLFTEPIPLANPQAGVHAATWGANRSWWGTWAYRAAACGFVESTKELIGGGVHPDDGAVFARRPVWVTAWHRDPQRLAFLLEQGADPDALEFPAADPRNSLVRLMLMGVRSEITRSDPDWGTVDQLLTGASMLLDAGAKRLDPAEQVETDMGVDGAAGRPAPQQTAVDLLLANLHRLSPSRPQRALAYQVLGRLATAGAALNRPSGRDQLPPLVRVVRNRDIDSVRALVLVGAETGDCVLVRDGDPHAQPPVDRILSLLDEAMQAGGAPFAAHVLEVLMSQAVAAGDARPACSRAPTAKRARAVL